MMHLATSIVMTIGSCYTGSKSLKSSFEKVMVGMLLGFLWDIVLIDMTTHKTSNCCVNDPLGKLIGLMMLFFMFMSIFIPYILLTSSIIFSSIVPIVVPSIVVEGPCGLWRKSLK